MDRKRGSHPRKRFRDVFDAACRVEGERRMEEFLFRALEKKWELVAVGAKQIVEELSVLDESLQGKRQSRPAGPDFLFN